MQSLIVQLPIAGLAVGVSQWAAGSFMEFPLQLFVCDAREIWNNMRDLHQKQKIAHYMTHDGTLTPPTPERASACDTEATTHVRFTPLPPPRLHRLPQTVAAPSPEAAAV